MMSFENIKFQMGLKKYLRSELEEFCSTCSIHGMGNISDQKHGFIYRSIWIIVVLTSLILAIVCIKSSVEGKYDEEIILILVCFRRIVNLFDVSLVCMQVQSNLC
jgi:hypothetical protein